MVDEEFRHPRLAVIDDALDPERIDLDIYVDIAEELGGRRVLDVGCGTGTLALMFTERGCDVIGVEPGRRLAGRRARQARRGRCAGSTATPPHCQ